VIAREVAWDKVSDYGIVVTDTEGRVRSFQEKPAREAALSNLASTGIYIFEPEALDFIPRGEVFDIGSQLFPLLTQKGVPFYAQKQPFNWIDIGCVKDFWSVMQGILQGDMLRQKVPGKQMAEGVWVGMNTRIERQGTTITGPVYIGSGCHIEAGSTIIGPAWIGHGSHVCAGARIVRSILFEYTRVEGTVPLHELVVFRDYCVTREGKMQHLSEAESSFWGNSRAPRKPVALLAPPRLPAASANLVAEL